MHSVPVVLGGRFQLVRKLDAGGMGSIWEAKDLNLQSEAAVKLIEASGPDAQTRFENEARAAAAIRSTHIVHVLQYGIDRGKPYIAMELLKGESLAKRLKIRTRLELEETVRLMTQAGEGLAIAHDRNIVHRDIKPDNVFIAREGTQEVVKLVDFGIARNHRRLGESEGLKTQTGVVLGTPHYMSAEQVSGQPIDHRSDIWSFAVVVCECLTGQRAYVGESWGALYRALCDAEQPVPSSLGVVPEGFDAWFAKATARDLQRRYQTIREAVSDLSSLILRSTQQVVVVGETQLPPTQELSALPTGEVAPTFLSPGPAREEQPGGAMSRPEPLPSAHRLRSRMVPLAAGALVLAALVGTAWWMSSRAAQPGPATGSEPIGDGVPVGLEPTARRAPTPRAPEGAATSPAAPASAPGTPGAAGLTRPTRVRARPARPAPEKPVSAPRQSAVAPAPAGLSENPAGF